VEGNSLSGSVTPCFFRFMKLRKTAIKATSGRRLTGKNPSKTARKIVFELTAPGGGGQFRSLLLCQMCCAEAAPDSDE
jgi:hypothetical protein